jgi:hypothetical protein
VVCIYGWVSAKEREGKEGEKERERVGVNEQQYTKFNQTYLIV